MDQRMSKDKYYLNIADAVLDRSTCPVSYTHLLFARERRVPERGPARVHAVIVHAHGVLAPVDGAHLIRRERAARNARLGREQVSAAGKRRGRQVRRVRTVRRVEGQDLPIADVYKRQVRIRAAERRPCGGGRIVVRADVADAVRCLLYTSCAHNLCAGGTQIPHVRRRKYYSGCK